MSRATRSILGRWERLVVAALCGVAASAAGEAHSADWMFRRSYYSHTVPPELLPEYPLPVSRSAYRRPLAGTTPGLAVRGGTRFNRIFLGHGGAADFTILREDYYELRP